MKLDVLLIAPPVRDFYLTQKRTIPYGLISIAANLQNHGLSVQILDCLATDKRKSLPIPDQMSYLNSYYSHPDQTPFAMFNQYRHFGYSYEYITQTVKKIDPGLIGISSLFTPYSDEALTVAHLIKKVLPESKIVMGGHHPTCFPEKVLSCHDVDYVIRGEGEQAMASLAFDLKQGRISYQTPGLCYKDPEGNIIVNPPVIVDDLDRLPLPAYALIKQKFYQRHKKASMVITASRGCPLGCSYCSMGNRSTIKYRKRSVASVMSEIITNVEDNGVRFIDFEDENLALDKTWFHKLLSEIIDKCGKHGLELRAMNGLFPPSLDFETILLMKQAGFTSLNLSIGSTQTTQQKRFNRPDVMEHVGNIIPFAHNNGLETVSYIIAGAPFQTPEDTMQDLIHLAGYPTLIGLSIFYPAPGSADYQICEQANLLPDSFAAMRSSTFPVSHLTDRLDQITFLRFSRIVNFLKHLEKNEQTLAPDAEPVKQLDVENMDRNKIGKIVLSWFFKDGKLRGVTPEGSVYEHQINLQLADSFRGKLKSVFAHVIC